MEKVFYEKNMYVSAEFEEVEGQLRIIFAVVCCVITEKLYTYKYGGGDEIIEGEPADLNPYIFNIIKSVNRKYANFYGGILN